MLNELIPTTRRILEETEELTGKKFRLIPIENLGTFARVKIARKSMAEHLVYYRPVHSDIINHLLAHECGHIIRTYRAPVAARVMPASSNEHLKTVKDALSDYLERFSGVIPAEQIESIVAKWHGGIVSQLTNQPVDIMIEKWLYDCYRDLQLANIRKQWNDAVNGLSTSIRQTTPSIVYDSSHLMNYAYFRHLGLHIGENFLKPYNSTPFIDRGKALAALLDSVPDDTFAGDLKKIAAWTDYLGLNGWFDWIDFEKVPEGYEEQVY